MNFVPKGTQKNSFKNKIKLIKYDKILGQKFYIQRFRYNFTKSELPTFSESDSVGVKLNAQTTNGELFVDKIPDHKANSMSSFTKYKASFDNFSPSNTTPCLGVKRYSQPENSQKSNLFPKERKASNSLARMENFIRNLPVKRRLIKFK